MARAGFIGSSLAARAALSVIFACAATASGAAESPQLREEVRQMLMMMDGLRDRTCAERKVANTEVLEARPDGAPSVERWTLDRCGELIPYRVRFFSNSKGGTDFDAQLEK
jgi:hypothetical protein